MKAEANYQTEEVADLMASPVAVAGDDTTAQLTRIWQELLGVEPIGIDQNYFDLGGDSILAVQLFAHIQKVFQIKLPVATLFEAPTIEELARILRRETAPASGWSPLVAIQPAGSRPPFFCVHGAGGNVLLYRDLFRHLGSDQPFYCFQSAYACWSRGWPRAHERSFQNQESWGRSGERMTARAGNTSRSPTPVW